MTPRPTTVSTRWWTILTAVLACGYLYIGATSPLPAIRWPTLAGALLVLGGLWLASRSHPIALAALIAGAVVPAITSWWSVVVPITGLLILLCGTVAIRAGRRPIGPRRSADLTRIHAREG
jgi:hypothetical protein